MEFRNWDSNADKVKLYESVRKGLAEIYEDETKAFSSAPVRENPYKDLDVVNEMDLTKYQVKVNTEKEQTKKGYSRVQKRVKNLMQKFSIYSRLLYFNLGWKIFNPGWNFSNNCNFFNSVYRIEISTRDENLHIIVP